MTGPSLFRLIFILAAVLAPFFFPYPYTLGLSFIASLFVPALAFMIGILSDALYLVPQKGAVPYASLIGAGVSLIALIVRRFIKARIISG